MITDKSSVEISNCEATIRLNFSNTWNALVQIPVHADRFEIAKGLRQLADLIEEGQSDEVKK